MTRTAKFAATACLLCCTTTYAEDMQNQMPKLYESEKFSWKHVDVSMSAREYEESSRYNQRVFGDAARNAFKETLTSFGMSKQSIKITGAAVGLAMEGAKFDLNESETLSFEVDDVVSDDRAVYFNLKLDW